MSSGSSHWKAESFRILGALSRCSAACDMAPPNGFALIIDLFITVMPAKAGIQ